MRQEILNKAIELFLTLGFKSVTMDDLAHEMGISKKTIYSHFKNKTKLVEECTTQVFENISGGIDHICSLNKNPIVELYEIKRLVMEHLNDERSSPQYQLQKYYPKIHQNIRKRQFKMMHACVVENIKHGIEEHMYRDNINIEFISRIYFSGVMSIKDKSLFPQENFPNTSLMDEFLEYHLRSIVTPKGRQLVNKMINSNIE
jgi:AcrR family transcriptional regulator